MEKLLSPLVDAIKKKKKVTFFLGAGVSTSCGIPDFRSPKTGLYANLKKLNLPHPEAVFDIDFFRENPKPFYSLCEELYPGNFLPSKFHFLLKLFEDKKLLKRIYTQNIDTLERIAGVSSDYIVEAHGSFADNHCIDCNRQMSVDVLKEQMSQKEINNGIPKCPKCKGHVKPDIVFFGELLPKRFSELWDIDCDEVEVAVVAGTSLTVYPFASLPSEVAEDTLRVLVNNEVVGDFDQELENDIVLQLDCDTIAQLLAEELDWHVELADLITAATEEFEKRKTMSKPESAQERAEEIAKAVKDAGKNPEKSEKSARAENLGEDPKTNASGHKNSDTEELEKKLDKLDLSNI
ncbi:CIC11C00000004581 [Sungouiella intermedia]|uniref:NAD-dependent protein deacetylase n=1 Tax=Sungouiella intermedia TaxID=45354 RepID=A0A1L0C5M0_9ASCO|nr:CIC11C00000004581 [[Candida] intermedia]